MEPQIYTAMSLHEKDSRVDEWPLKPDIADDVRRIVKELAVSDYTHHYRSTPGRRRCV